MEQIENFSYSQRKVFRFKDDVKALVGEKLTLQAFFQLSGELSGISYVKVIVEVDSKTVHFMNDHKFKLHAKYLADSLLKISEEQLCQNIDDINQKFYYGENRPYFLGILALNFGEKNPFFTLETVEVDDMNAEQLIDFYSIIKRNIFQKYPLYLRPANHHQEETISKIPTSDLPRVYSYELMKTRTYIPLSLGETKGRVRYFKNLQEYHEKKSDLQWFDIVVMEKVPDDIPRVSGLINTKHTTPLSHTNVLACGWQIPNSIQLKIEGQIEKNQMNGKWVFYKVGKDDKKITLETLDQIPEHEVPPWKTYQILLDPPEIGRISVSPLKGLKMKNARLHGTKAANLGEVLQVLQAPSQRLLGFYATQRYPRKHLLDYLKARLNLPKNFKTEDLHLESFYFLKKTIKVPQGISLPFSFQRSFLEKFPQIQQTIGKLKMALQLNSSEIESTCLKLQQLIRSCEMSKEMKEKILKGLKKHLPGCQKFVVRSSSNAEDLQHFSAAGIYESYNHVTDIEEIFESIKGVWASLVSPRSVRLRQEVGMSLDDCYMGVIIQEEIDCDFGGVMVTTNPMNPRDDFRNVYINASANSTVNIVEGKDCTFQMLFNIVEGQGRTIGKDTNVQDLTSDQINVLARFALAGKLLESHFSPNDEFKLPVDIEWAMKGNDIYLLQIRPYAIE